MGQFEFFLRDGQSKRSTGELSEALSNWRGSEERWLFVAPHDDDIVLGGGLLLQAALEKKIPLRMLITTDGSMGYCTADQRTSIKEIRAAETKESFDRIGVNDVQWLGFPDCDLARQSGRRIAQQGDPAVTSGYTGLQNSYTAAIRDFRPTRLFVPGGNDYHPDHKTVYQELMISVFHASGQIWPELGEQLNKTPIVYEMAIYCDFAQAPNLMVQSSEEALQKKLEAIATYRSQVQIDQLVQNVRKGGPVELFREVAFDLYHTQRYLKDFL